MSILGKPKPELQVVADQREEVLALRARVNDLTGENQALRDQLEGNIPAATAWLQTKVWRQRAVLDRENRTLIGQRFALRTLESLGRGLTREEYLLARKAAGNDRIPEKV